MVLHLYKAVHRVRIRMGPEEQRRFRKGVIQHLRVEILTQVQIRAQLQLEEQVQPQFPAQIQIHRRIKIALVQAPEAEWAELPQ